MVLSVAHGTNTAVITLDVLLSGARNNCSTIIELLNSCGRLYGKRVKLSHRLPKTLQSLGSFSSVTIYRGQNWLESAAIIHRRPNGWWRMSVKLSKRRWSRTLKLWVLCRLQQGCFICGKSWGDIIAPTLPTWFAAYSLKVNIQQTRLVWNEHFFLLANIRRILKLR